MNARSKDDGNDGRARQGDAKPRICFVAHNAYGALAGIDTGHVGGIERQTSLMARWFAGHGYDVSMITWDEGQCDGESVAGVRVFKMCRREAGIKGLRFFHPKWRSLWRAMQRADADIYYYNCGDLGLGQIAMWCQRRGRRCMFSVASDSICDSELAVLKPLRERILYRYGLTHSHAVVVQTRHQQEMLREGFGIRSCVVPMPCEGVGKATDMPTVHVPADNPRVLWVGRISREKRFEWLLDVAERCREIAFDVAGAANEENEYSLTLIRRASGTANVTMHGRVAHAQIGEYYRRCHVLCCTSAYEGFPNTFLEAWSCGIPVVTTFDPDGIVAKYGLGWTASCVEELVTAVRESVSEGLLWQAASVRARDYYERNHTLDSCMNQFARIVRETGVPRSPHRRNSQCAG